MNELISGPIFLDKLLCEEGDSKLQECNFGIVATGLTACNHSQDVWLRCIGQFFHKFWSSKHNLFSLYFTDIDECMISRGGCEHECNNSIGSFECLCHSGYSLHLNGFNCTGIFYLDHNVPVKVAILNAPLSDYYLLS